MLKILYKDFLVVNKKPYKGKIKICIICSLFDISSIPITSNILKYLSLYEFALDLDGALLKLDDKSKTWKTIHPRWDLELLKYLFSITNSRDRNDLDAFFLESVNSILNLNDNKFNQINKFGIVRTLYATITIDNFINMDKMDELLNPEKIAQQFDNDGKFDFFITLSYSYGLLKKFNKTLLFSTKAIEINPQSAIAHYNKGLALSNLGKNEEAIKEYDKALEIDPKYVDGYYNKGNSFL